MIKNLTIASGTLCLAISSTLHAGTFSEEIIAPDDTATGISPSKTYTHLVDFGTDDGGSVVNGVAFTEGGTTGTNYSITGTNNTFQNYGSNYPAASGMFDLSDDFFFGGAPLQTITLTGLTPGTTYLMSNYLASGWNGAIQDVDGDDDGLGFNILTTDRGDASGPKIIRYEYTQAPGDTDFSMTFDAVNDADGFHQYGFSNEVVIPEPASVALLGVAAVGFLSRRRRS